jgi:hypothetical protein
MSDIDAVVHDWESCALPLATWQKHETHLRVALWHLLHYEEAEATRRMRDGIQRFNAANGIEMTPTGGYHETITLAALQLIAAYLDQVSREQPFEMLATGLLEQFPSTKTLMQYYSRDLLMSWEARTEWVEPDVAPLRPLKKPTSSASAPSSTS